jgi:hypothetical protein
MPLEVWLKDKLESLTGISWYPLYLTYEMPLPAGTWQRDRTERIAHQKGGQFREVVTFELTVLSYEYDKLKDIADKISTLHGARFENDIGYFIHHCFITEERDGMEPPPHDNTRPELTLTITLEVSATKRGSNT